MESQVQAAHILQMNFYEYILDGAKQPSTSTSPHTGEVFAMDATVTEFKRPLSEVFPTRIRVRKNLIDFMPKDFAKKVIAENVSLIKTITGKKNHEKIARYIMKVFKGERTQEELEQYLEKIGGVSEERAALIANDQITKATEMFKVERLRQRGCKMVQWKHMGAVEPRDYHLRQWNGKSGKRNGRPNGLNGFIFPIDKPPVIDLKTLERGYPGQMINCHCHLVPLWKK